MSATITPTELDQIIQRFGNYAVLQAQKLVHAVFPGGWLPPSVLIALGLRESNLQNICGGAAKVNGQWVQAYTDRGWLQITDTQPTNAKWLATVPGCPNDSWVPSRGHTAIEQMHCPTMSAATNRTLAELTRNRQLAYAGGVKPDDALRFIVAAHNAGFTGALTGYQAGDVDQHTTHGDYSNWVLEYAPKITAWIESHPGWKWHPPKGT